MKKNGFFDKIFITLCVLVGDTILNNIIISLNALPSSLIDSNVSLKR
jgi:hypothetical protein